MKVLLLGPSIQRTPGGMATVLQGILDNDVLAEKCTIQYMPTHAEGGAVIKIFFFLRAALYIFFRGRQFDIAHINVASHASFWRKTMLASLARRKGLRVILHTHAGEFEDFYASQSEENKRKIRDTFQKSDRIIALSPHWASFYSDLSTGIPVDILPNAVDCEKYEKCFQTDDFHHFLFLGRLWEAKGTTDLVSAVVSLSAEYRAKLRFYLCGDGEVDEYRELVKTQGLEDTIEVVGWISGEEKLEMFSRTGCIVHPSHAEALPMSLIEAMAAGKVVIASAVGGIPDLVTEPENGFLIQPKDTKTLAERILYVAEHPEEMAEVCRNNREKIKSLYDARILGDRLAKLYEQTGTIQKRK